MKPRFSPTAMQWRATTLLISSLVPLSMWLPGSYSYKQGMFVLAKVSGNYLFPGLFDDFWFFAGASILLGIITFLQCLRSMVKDKMSFLPLCVTGSTLLCMILVTMIGHDIMRTLQNGNFILLLPPLLVILMLTAAFFALSL